MAERAPAVGLRRAFGDGHSAGDREARRPPAAVPAAPPVPSRQAPRPAFPKRPAGVDPSVDGLRAHAHERIVRPQDAQPAADEQRRPAAAQPFGHLRPQAVVRQPVGLSWLGCSCGRPCAARARRCSSGRSMAPPSVFSAGDAGCWTGCGPATSRTGFLGNFQSNGCCTFILDNRGRMFLRRYSDNYNTFSGNRWIWTGPAADTSNHEIQIRFQRAKYSVQVLKNLRRLWIMFVTAMCRIGLRFLHS